MRKLLLLVITLTCSTHLLGDALDRQAYINKANNGDVDAMLSLYEHYPFYAQTGDGLSSYEKWFTRVNKNHDADKIYKLIEVYQALPGAFVNQADKIERLYDLSYQAGGHAAAIHLIKESPRWESDKAIVVYNKVHQMLNEKELTSLLDYAQEYTVEWLAKSLTIEYKRRGLTIKATPGLMKALVKKDNEPKLKELETAFIKNGDYKSLNQLASVYQERGKSEKSSQLFKAVLKLQATNQTALEGLLGIYRKGFDDSAEDIEKSVNYSLLAVKQHNSQKALINLLTLYLEDEKYLKYYPVAVKGLMKTIQGKKELIRFYRRYYLYEYALDLTEELANAGDSESQVDMVLSIPFDKRMPSHVEFESKKKYWRNKVLTSEDKQQISLLYQKIIQRKEVTELQWDEITRFASDNLDIVLIRLYLEENRYDDERDARFEQLAIDSGDVESSLKVAENYTQYSNVPAIHQKGLEIYEELANKGDKQALDILTGGYGYGFRDIGRNIDKALPYFIIFAELKDKSSIHWLIDYYGKKGNDEQRFIWMQKSAELGSDKYHYSLGYAYYFAKGTKTDFSKAKYYFENASDEDKKNAYTGLGLLYENGEGVEQNYLKAQFYYELSAQMGSSYAYYYLGKLFEKGHTGKVDIDKAIEYYKKSDIEQARERLKVILGSTSNKGEKK